MIPQIPMVSVSMATYNHEKFISKAIESVLQQETDFPFELVIGEDCSTDLTRKICEQYAEKFPEKIRLLPAETNLGMSRNGIRILSHCRGKYVANLDGDDYWIDPYKLRDQVQFLEQNPDYGLVYSDIAAVDEAGVRIKSDLLDERRTHYQKGYVFFKLLRGPNFINSCTAIFKREFLPMDALKVDKYWFSYDLWIWLRIALQTKVFYFEKDTACYRTHSGGITNSIQFKKDRQRVYYVLYDIITQYHKYNHPPLKEGEKMFLFQKMISLLYRRQGSLKMKIQILKIIPKYFPGLLEFANMLMSKTRRFKM